MILKALIKAYDSFSWSKAQKGRGKQWFKRKVPRSPYGCSGARLESRRVVRNVACGLGS